MMMNCFCGMVDRPKAFSLISSRDHCQRSSLSRISDTPSRVWTCAEPEFRLSWMKLRSSDNHNTTAPELRTKAHKKVIFGIHVIHFLLGFTFILFLFGFSCWTLQFFWSYSIVTRAIAPNPGLISILGSIEVPLLATSLKAFSQISGLWGCI